LTARPFSTGLSYVLQRDSLLVAASLVALCGVAWLFLIHLAAQMEGMDGYAARMMGMAADDRLSRLFGAALSPRAAILADATVNLALVALMWAVMMVGMMLPSAAPTILLFSALERRRTGGGVSGRRASFIAGYIAIWTVFSVAAALAQTALAYLGLLSMDMVATSGLLAGAMFMVGGAYELTSLKGKCLIHCQSPLEWIPRHMRPGRIGALRMGAEHAAYCVGCCWALMLLLFVGGVMNLVWVAVVGGFVLAQKLVPGAMVARFAGVALLLGGALLVLRAVVSA
jgi:predicted metal-binding membrane protein